MFDKALSGDLPITPNSTSGGLAKTREELRAYEDEMLRLRELTENALNAALEVCASTKAYLELPPSDDSEYDNSQTLAIMKSQHQTALADVTKYQAKLSEI